MKVHALLSIVVTSLLLAVLARDVRAQGTAAAPPLVTQINNGNWLSPQDAQALVDELYYQRAVHAYMTMLPALNTIGMRDGSEAVFGSGYNVLPIWKDRMDSRTWVPTPNADVIYSMSYLDLKKDGPLVVAAPPQVIGMFTDFFQRTITDVGLVSRDRARGGLYLLLPPDYDGPTPSGYFTFKSSTYNVLLFFRTIMTKGPNGPDPAPAVVNAERTRVYPLWAPEKVAKAMQFPNGSGRRINMMYPTDNTYWTKLKTFVDYEPRRHRSRVARRARVDWHRARSTVRAHEQAAGTVEARGRDGAEDDSGPATDRPPDGRNKYYTDRQYENIWAGGTAEWLQDGYLDIPQRAAYFQLAYSSAPAMVMRTLDAGSKYPFTVRDADGDFLHGANAYRLHLPPNPPASLFWAVTSYNITDGTMTEAAQLMPSINAFNTVTKNADGSVDLWFGPAKPAAAPQANWIQTVSGRDFLVAVRLYGTGVEFFDQTWKPDDVVKVK